MCSIVLSLDKGDAHIYKPYRYTFNSFSVNSGMKAVMKALSTVI